MSSKDESLKSYLETLTGKSVFVLEKPEGNNDCIVYKRVSTKRFRTHSGPLAGYVKERFQVEVYNADIAACRTVVNTIINGLDGNYSTFKCSIVENNFDVRKMDIGLYMSVIDVFII